MKRGDVVRSSDFRAKNAREYMIPLRFPNYVLSVFSRLYSQLCFLRPSATRRRLKLAYARRTHKSFADTMPGLGERMWIRPEGYFNQFYSCGRMFESEVISFLRSHIKHGMTIFDIGAHEGYLTLLMAKLVGPEGIVIAFEPGQYAFGQLVANTKLNDYINVVTQQIALSDNDGYEMYYEAVSEQKSVYNSLECVDVPWASPSDFVTREIIVSRLDSLMVEERWPFPNLIKMDVEGAEMKVIDGMHDVLNSTQGLTLIFECSKQLCLKFGYSVNTLLRKIERYGFKCSALGEAGVLKPIDRTNESWVGGIIVAQR
jgi:FkbM family methyltransferase